MRLSVISRWICAGFAALAAASGAPAAEINVAVAADFEPVLQRLAPVFQQRSGDRLRITPGSTGKLYAQITEGAPFDVFLAADVRRPQLLESRGLTVAGSRFTYAVGRLALWLRRPAAGRGLQALADGRIRRFAIANPDVAPYGAAAVQALRKAGLWQQVKAKAVYGENVGQTFHYVASGTADAGLVAMSQILLYTGPKTDTAYWPVPARDYAPLQQQAILLRHGGHKPAAAAFMAFLKSADARAMMRRYGYGP